MDCRSSSKRCLLCLAYCEDGGGDQPKFQMAGAMNFDPLQRQLENVFILRQVLNVPKHWCEEILRGEGSDGGLGGDGGDLLRMDVESNNPADWFSVCGNCMESGVAEAWKVYQQIMALQLKMSGIKEKILERMKREILKPGNRGGVKGRRKGVSVEGKIMEYLFSGLIEEKEEEILLKVDPSNYLDDDDDHHHHDADWNIKPEVVSLEDDEEEEEDANWEDDFLNLPLILFKEKSKRGRPLKSEVKGVQLRKRLKDKLKRIGKGLPTAPASQNRKRGAKISKYRWYRCKVPNCDAIYSNEDDFKGHLLCHEERKEKLEEKGPLDCPHCAFPGRDLEELEQHVEDRHLKKGTKLYPYFCPFCEFVTPEEKNKGYPSLREHVDQSHKKEGGGGGGGGGSEEELISELPMICNLCPKKCANLRAFLTHHRKSHPEQYGIQVENLECDHDQCGLKFSTREDLRSHVRNTHKRCSKFVCDECGMGFKFLSRMERHKIAHYNNLRKEYICHICGVEYAYKSILDSHYRQFHPRGDGGGEGGSGNSLSGGGGGGGDDGGGEEFKCKYCELTSPFKVVILRHLRQHKEEMGHKCEHCGKCYVNIQGLKRHLRINHPVKKEEVPCPHCLKCFISVEYMRDHMNKFCRMKKLVNESLTKQEVVTVPVSVSLSSLEAENQQVNSNQVIGSIMEGGQVCYQDGVDNHHHRFIGMQGEETGSLGLGVKMDLG